MRTADAVTSASACIPMSEPSDIWEETILSAGELDLVLLPGIGGRLWDIRLAGQSLLFQNPDLAQRALDVSSIGELPTRSPQFGFPLWGGEKTWIAPETDWPNGRPHTILDSGPYRIVKSTGRSIQMKSEACPTTGLVVSRELNLASSSKWTLTHSLGNQGNSSRRCGIWSVMMLEHPNSVGVPGTEIEIATVFDTHDGRVLHHDGGAIARCDGLSQFKVALSNPHGSSLIRAADRPIWLLCRTTPPKTDDRFAHGAPFEIFNSGDYNYSEAEWHSSLALLSPGDTRSFRQTFHIWEGDEGPPETRLTQSERKLMVCMS